MTDNECPIAADELTPETRKYVGAAPSKLKMMAARGLAPMPPKDLVTVQYVLTFDPDDRISEVAAKSLGEMDARIANAVLSDLKMPPPVLGYLAQKLARQDTFAEKLLLNSMTPNQAFVEVAKVCSEKIAEIVANNQDRLWQTPEIARSLCENPNALKSTRERVIDYLVRRGKILEDVPEFAEAFVRLNGEDRIAAASAVALPKSMLDKLDARFDAEGAERRLISEEDEAGEEEPEDQPLEVLLRSLNAAQKVAMATKGNRTVRKTLMRDTNRLVALAAISSPCVTEPEVIEAATSKVVHQDVITHIAKDKKNNWTRVYQVKLAIVQNPKAPLPEAMKLLPLLQQRDLKTIAKSKNVPTPVRNQANNILRRQRR